jgi:DNA-directed RNA polymerase specialized sigma24 family protein
VRNPADAGHLAQQVLLRLVRGLPSLRDGEKPRAWAYRCAHNAIVDYCRSPYTRREVPSGASALEECRRIEVDRRGGVMAYVERMPSSRPSGC